MINDQHFVAAHTRNVGITADVRGGEIGQRVPLVRAVRPKILLAKKGTSRVDLIPLRTFGAARD